MKKPLILIIALGLIVGGFWVSQQSHEAPTEQIVGLPWQIDVTPEGYTRVFGISPGRDSIQDVTDNLSGEHELAILVPDNQDPALELYYGRFVAGVFSGKLVLGTDISQDKLSTLVESAAKLDYMDNGTRKFQINPDDLEFVHQQIVTNVAFIPAVGLDREIVKTRFGEPAEEITDSGGNIHFLYPEKGLDVAIMNKGRDVLQYVMPADFPKLRDPVVKNRAVEDME